MRRGTLHARAEAVKLCWCVHACDCLYPVCFDQVWQNISALTCTDCLRVASAMFSLPIGRFDLMIHMLIPHRIEAAVKTATSFYYDGIRIFEQRG